MQCDRLAPAGEGFECHAIGPVIARPAGLGQGSGGCWECEMVEDVAPPEVFEALRSDRQARLVDVRTDAEWAFVGLPELGQTGHDPVLIPWQVFPSMQVNAGFVDHLRQAGLTAENKLYFLCRSGGRSLAAARAAQAAGFVHAFNVSDGFEGPPDDDGHRGQVAGWKASGLPWQQR